MKKLMFLLAAIMFLYSFNAYAAQPEQKVIDDLQAFHIIEKEDNIKSEDFVTRAEFVKMLCITTSYEIGHVAPIEFFSDVTKDHWAVKYIAVAYEDNIIHGYDDNTFRPESNITYQEMLKMIVCALGYDVYANNAGGYPDGYLTYSKNLGIIRGLSFNNNAYATRGDAMCMIYNALDIPLLVLMQTNVEEDGSRTPIYQLRDGVTYPFESLRMILNRKAE